MFSEGSNFTTWSSAPQVSTTSPAWKQPWDTFVAMSAFGQTSPCIIPLPRTEKPEPASEAIRERGGGNAPGVHGDRLGERLVVLPVLPERLRSGDEGEVVPPEGTVVLPREHHVVLRANEHQRHGKAVPADRLRQTDDVGGDAGILEAEELPRPTAPHLDVVHDQQATDPLGQGAELAQPGTRGDVDSPFRLHGLDQEGGRRLVAAARIRQKLVNHVHRVDGGAEVAVERVPIHVG